MLRTLKTRKLTEHGILRLVEYGVNQNESTTLLKNVGFRHVVFRVIPIEEAHTETEFTAHDQFGTSQSKGLPIEILAFR